MDTSSPYISYHTARARPTRLGENVYWVCVAKTCGRCRRGMGTRARQSTTNEVAAYYSESERGLLGQFNRTGCTGHAYSHAESAQLHRLHRSLL